jgi:hypothetical protein
MSFVSHVECTVCGHAHDPTHVLSVCEQCGQMLAVRYDIERVKASLTKDALRSRPPGMYRFRELTPLAADEEPVTLGEGATPLLPLPRLAAHLGLRHVWGKDEGQNPTGSFKARGLASAISKAKELGIAAARVASSSLDKITAEYLEQQLVLAHPELAAAPSVVPPQQAAEISPAVQPAMPSPSISTTQLEPHSVQIQEVTTSTATLAADVEPPAEIPATPPEGCAGTYAPCTEKTGDFGWPR